MAKGQCGLIYNIAADPFVAAKKSNEEVASDNGATFNEADWIEVK